MGQFFKFLFASCLGVLLAIGAIIFIGGAIFSSFASNMNKAPAVKPNTVLHLTLNKPLPELTNNISVSPLAGFEDLEAIGLQSMVDAIERAKDDDNIKGIFIEPSLAFSAGFSTAKSIRDAIEDFGDSGKFVVAHSGFYTQGQYYVASAADEIYANPMGYFWTQGFSVTGEFYKDLIDKLGVKMQVFYVGTFKGATEPYRRTNFSPENKLQLRQMINDYYNVFLEDVARTRDLDKGTLKSAVDSYINSPELALENGMIDKIDYRTSVIDRLKERAGLDKDDKLPMMSIESYNKSNPAKTNYKIKDRVAVVYAEGTILDGKWANGTVTDRQYVKDINKLAEDDKVKAIVLRVNSPGGSALASENIWNALQNVKANDKPLIVSMGDYAASGGYYISCPADSIFAEPNTLTGSIGIFSIVPAVGPALDKMLGIDYDTVKTGPLAQDALTPIFELEPGIAKKWQKDTEDGYRTFLQRVADGRGMTPEEVDKVAQGRVWTGSKATTLGLVDKVGSLDRAIASAVSMAELDEYRVVTYPKVKDPVQQLIDEILNPAGMSRTVSKLEKDFPLLAPYYSAMIEIQKARGPQAKMMIDVPFN
ncbi:MAG: signal peptide peptidase SppA [Bacteroidota bacterium]